MDADTGVEVEDGDRVVKWTNQVAGFPAQGFVKRDEGRAQPGSGRPTLKKAVSAIGNHDTLVFRGQELINHDEDAFDHLLTGNGYTWFAVPVERKLSDQSIMPTGLLDTLTDVERIELLKFLLTNSNP